VVFIDELRKACRGLLTFDAALKNQKHLFLKTKFSLNVNFLAPNGFW